MGPYMLIGIAACLGVIWTVALAGAIHRNNHPRVTIHPDGRQSLHLVDFGPLFVAGIAIGALEIAASVWFGLTVN